MMSIVLASNSPRRRQLLALGGWDFSVVPAEVDERPRLGEEAPDYVSRVAESKARAVSSQARENDLVIAADTAVVDEMGILGKPVDSADAIAMLRRLRGSTHQVYTAVVVARGGLVLKDICATDVPMRDYPEEEIQAYVASGDPLDKAGAYAIQHAGFHPVDELAGCYANVVGLPLCHLARTLRKVGLSPREDVPLACQSALGYRCPVYGQVLKGY